MRLLIRGRSMAAPPSATRERSTAEISSSTSRFESCSTSTLFRVMWKR